jgi:transposase-like protein
LQLWFYAIYLFTQTRSGVSAKELQRQLGVTYKAAWRMGHEIRKHMAFVDGDDPLSGTVEVDETFIGGHRKNGQGGKGKAVLLGMLDRDGDVMTQVVPDRTVKTIYPILRDNIEKGSTVHTDEHGAYRSLGTSGYKHQSVNHSAKEYARGDCHTNTIESYWSRLKTSINGTHIHVSGKHLQKYAGEFEYRFNSRNHGASMLPELLGTYQKPSKK